MVTEAPRMGRSAIPSPTHRIIEALPARYPGLDSSPRIPTRATISTAAYYRCGIRALDAERVRPLCGDHRAHRFADAEAHTVSVRFAGRRGPNITRNQNPFLCGSLPTAGVVRPC